jgi:SAM-dependent methyltransferase
LSIIPKHKDPIGRAVLDYFSGKPTEGIHVKTDIAEDELLDPSYFFRSYTDMPLQEQEALKRCKGKILDVGAGAGAHSIWLQEEGYEVDSIDISPLSCKTMLKRGVKNVFQTDIRSLKDKKYDTILLLMNGIGVAQTLDGLENLLSHLKTLLNPGGQILADSSDLIYLFQDEDGSALVDINSDKYYGEVEYQITYKDIKGSPFPWIYVDPESFKHTATNCGYKIKEETKGNHFDYFIAISI